MLKLRMAASIIAVGAALVGAGPAGAQNYPNKPLRLLTAEAGGGADLVARFVAQGISEPLGQQVIVENRPASLIGELVARAMPDGYTLMLASSTFLFAPLFAQMNYDVARDFSPVAMLAQTPNVIVVHPSVPVKSVKELIALAKAKPGALNYGSGGTGSSLHLAAELFKQMAGVDIARINYKGTGPAINDLLGGQLQMVFATAGAVMRYVSAGKLRALAVTSSQPSELAPGLPTVAASGLPGYEMEAIYALIVPARTPTDSIKTLNQVTVRFLSQPDTKEKFLKSGLETAPSSPEELGVKLKSEIAKIAKLVKGSGLRAY